MNIRNTLFPYRHQRTLLLLALGAFAPHWSTFGTEAPTFGAPVSTGTVSVPGLIEASGLVASRSNKDVFWTHNDKGGLPRIYAFARTGETLGIYNLPGASSVDYEDITVGPGPIEGIDYLYIGDMGDGNKAPVRETIQIYRAPEPYVYLGQASNPVETSLTGLTTIHLKYPDGPRNAETLMMDPLTGDLYIVPLTKLPTYSGIYRVTREQLLTGGTITMSREGEVLFAVASGGDISPTGREIVLRQERHANIWLREPGQTVAQALAEPPLNLPIVGKPVEQNGEAIAFDPEGRGYYTVSDSSVTQPLYYFERTSAFTVAAPKTVVDSGSEWIYDDAGPLPPADWFSPSFDVSDWKTSKAPFAYGRGDNVTTLNPRSETNANGQRTTYFRTEFDADSTTALDLRLLVDGGARVYLNDALVGTVHLTNGIVDQSNENKGWHWVSLLANTLKSKVGTNTLAVELLQSTASPSVRFDARVTTIETPPTASRIRSLKVIEGMVRLSIESPSDRVTVQSSPDLTSWNALGEAVTSGGKAAFETPVSAARFFRLTHP